MDNDSTTITTARSSFDSSLKIISDFNHTKKNFISKLYGKGLFKDLKAVFESFSKNREKLINVGSTQRNECFNRTVASTNPKSHFNSSSESTSFRVAAAVAQKNTVANFLTKANCV